MKIFDLYRNLANGVLRNLAMSQETPGAIRAKDQETVILAANEALLRLYSRFNLREKDVLIRQTDGVTNYHLLKRFAETHEPRVERHTYIMDLVLEPFEQDVIKVLAVYNSDGYQMPLNDNEAPWSLFTPQANVLQVPNPEPGKALSVMYQARHPELDHLKLEQPIELPDVLHGALFSYIGYQVYDAISTPEALARSQSLLMSYTSICDEAASSDAVQTSISTTNSRFEKRGWC